MTALSTHKLTHPEGRGDEPTRGWGSGGRSPEGVEGSRVVLQKSPQKSLQLSNTGFFRGLADKRRLGEWLIDIA